MFPVRKELSGSGTNKLITKSVMQLRTAPSQIKTFHQTILPATSHQLLSHRFLFSFIPELKFAKGKSMKFLLSADSLCGFILTTRFHTILREKAFCEMAACSFHHRLNYLRLEEESSLGNSARLVMTRGGEAGEFLSDFST